MKKTARKSVDNSQKTIVIGKNGKNELLSNVYRLMSNDASAPRAGFSLIEVLVAATILATLVGGVLLTLNPIGQINKGQDSQRMSDLQAVKTALDLYYNDTGCYPKSDDGNPATTDDGIPFDKEWSVNNTVYMKQVPQDPKCDDNIDASCYRYRTVTNADDPNYDCPQWNVVFAQLSKASALTNTCPLSSLSNCTPEGYDEGKFACTMSGGVDCDALLATSLLGGIETVVPTNTPTPGPPTPTPTPDPNDVTFPLPQSTNPDPYSVTLNPMYPAPATAQTFRVSVADPGIQIQSVEVVVISDELAQHSIFLNPPTGTQNNSGVWTGTRPVGNQETFYDHYAVEIYITAGTGASEIVGFEGLPLVATGR